MTEPVPCQKIDVTECAQAFRASVRHSIETRYGGKGPHLVGFLANDDASAKQYAQWTGKACTADKITFELREVPRTSLEDELEKANEDPNVHGIMIYYPVFGNRPSFCQGSMDAYLRDCVSHEKDVEGLCHLYRHNLYRNRRFVDADQTQKSILPCTPLAIVKILESLNVYDHALETGNRLSGKTVTIINRSEIVGHPLAAMLANDGADVYSADISSMYLFQRKKLSETKESTESACKKSQVIIAGVPSPSFRIPLDWIADHCVVINVSPHPCVDEPALFAAKQGVRYVPQVGKVTVAMLERNLMRLFENFAKTKPAPAAAAAPAAAVPAAAAESTA